MLHVFNKTYTNFRTPYKHVIQGVEQNQNVTKLKNNWLFHEKRPRSTFEIEPSKPCFIFKSLFFFWQDLPGKYTWQELFKSPPGTQFFPDPPPFFKIWDWKLSTPAERGGGRLILWFSIRVKRWLWPTFCLMAFTLSKLTMKTPEQRVIFVKC